MLMSRRREVKEQEEKIRREAMRKEILAHAYILADEMNMRLFLEAENGEMFFVEQISITDIQFPEKKRRSLLRKLKIWLHRVLKNLRFLR